MLVEEAFLKRLWNLLGMIVFMIIGAVFVVQYKHTVFFPLALCWYCLPKIEPTHDMTQHSLNFQIAPVAMGFICASFVQGDK